MIQSLICHLKINKFHKKIYWMNLLIFLNTFDLFSKKIIGVIWKLFTKNMSKIPNVSFVKISEMSWKRKKNEKIHLYKYLFTNLSITFGNYYYVK